MRNGQSIAQGGEAMVFLASMRGQYIVSQALHYGIEALTAVEPETMQEKSNISDMEFLRDSLFNLYPLLREG